MTNCRDQNSNSERHATVGNCRGFGHAPHVTYSPLGWVTHDVTVIHVPLIRQASAFLQRVLRVVSTGELFWAAKLEVG